jgi:hypothetical protein
MTLVSGCNVSTQGQGKFRNETLAGLSVKVGWFGQRTKVDLGLRFIHIKSKTLGVGDGKIIP